VAMACVLCGRLCPDWKAGLTFPFSAFSQY
jgi:hypothetical protein